MPDTSAIPAPAPQPAPAAAVVPAAPAPPMTGEQLIPVAGLRLVLDPGDASPLGHPQGATAAPVPPGAIDETAADPSRTIS